jgi:TRAP-type uncharacterized transport system substrate-binding protein
MESGLIRPRRYTFCRTSLIVLLFCLGACEHNRTELKLHALAHAAAEADALGPIFEQQSHLHITRAETNHTVSALEMLASGQVDLALVENSSPFQTGVRAVLPVYKSVLHLMVREGDDFSDPEQPLRGKKVYVTNGSPAGVAFTRMAAERQRLDPHEYQIVTELAPGEPDIIVYFGPINTRNPSWYVPGYRLHSLDFDDSERAMSSRAISYMMPQMQPKIIPARTYDLPGNEKGLHTVAVDALLATRKGVSENAIYELARTLLEQKPRFVAVSPEIFSGIREDFDPLALNFPLHAGSRRYLARDEPSALERYAESINLLVYLVFLVLTGLVGLTRWHARRKKDRIDGFYSRILDIRLRAASEPPEELLHELQQLELEAFQSLTGEKLAADESFRIFIELLTRAMADIERSASRSNAQGAEPGT